MNNSMINLFQYEGKELRFVDGKPVANDVAKILGYADPASTVSKKVKPKYRSVAKMETVDGKLREVTVLEEGGIYQLILGSQLPTADQFQDWLFEEVLPSIRKTGKYETKTLSDSVSMLTLIQNSLKVVEGLIIKQEQLELKLALEAQRTDKLEEVVAQHDAELDRIFKPHGDYYTAMGYGNLLGMKLSLKEASNIGKKASAKCRELGITIEQTRDPRFGTVGLYPETILKECF